MKYRNVEHTLPGGVTGLVAGILLLLTSASTSLAGQFAIGDVPSETPDQTIVPESTRESTDPEEDQTGGIVVSPTSINNEGVAPGQVDLVIITSDGGMVPAGTTACIGEVCQSLPSDQASGFKWHFDRMKEGWQEIRIRGSGPYDGAVSSVQVAPGGLVTARVEISRVMPRQEEGVGNTPPPGQESPPRNDGSRPRESSTTDPDGAQRFAQVTDLPETGSGAPAAQAILVTLTGAAVVLLALAAVVRQREMRRQRDR